MGGDDEAGTSKSAKPQGSSQRKEPWVRGWAVVCAAKCLDFATGAVDFVEAATYMRKPICDGAAKEVHENLPTFIERWWNNFAESGCVKDAHRSGRPPIISEEDALAASKILKAGHWVEVSVKGFPGAKRDELLYYSTLPEALAKSPALRAIQQKYDCTPDALLRRMHAVDPDLIRVTLVAHHQFSEEELQARINWCLAMLERYKADRSILLHIVFVDESTFVLHGLSKHSVQVYCSSGAARPSDVCYISDKELKPIKVHFILAVTAHPAFEKKNGVVLYEECTGTTGINRRTNKRLDGSCMDGKFYYETQKGAPALSTTKEEMEELLHIICKTFQTKTHSWPYLSIDNASIQAGIDVTCLKRENQDPISLPADHNLHIPKYSPDINRAVEHQFGGGKPRVRNEIYSRDHVVKTAAELRAIVHDQFTNKVVPGSVYRDVMGLPLLWEIISTPANQEWHDEHGRLHCGTGGNWGPRGSF